MTVFDKWWNDTKKHEKRVTHWLPHLRDLASRIDQTRGLRYFTLCARPMIDVFMLVKEGILARDAENYSIASVCFCECEEEHFSEIKELIAREDAGFFGRLEDIVLFDDNDFTGQFPTRDSISIALEDEGLSPEQIDKLQLKRTFLDVRSSFPYDYVNLDFCDYYYPIPDMLKINKTVERILDWQTLINADGFQLGDFVIAVTCRYDSQFPNTALQRLSTLIQANCETFPDYKAQIEESRQVDDVRKWIDTDHQDIFLAGWPKDIAWTAKEHGWKAEILDYVYYHREDSGGEKYVMACAVIRFTRPTSVPDYLPTALYALRKENRKFIEEIPRDSDRGKELLANLAAIVALRNEQARRMERIELPAP